MPSIRPKRRTTTINNPISGDDGSEAALDDLTRPELLAIHRAFAAAAAGPSRPPPEPSGGGFVPDDSDLAGGFVREEESVGGGGFVPDDADEQDSSGRPATPTSARTIGLAQVPDALKMLKLPYRDSDILEIFADAASSDDEPSDDGRAVRRRSERDKRVRRADFAKVCAVLMAARRGDASPVASSVGGASDGEVERDGSVYGGASDAASSASDDSGSFRPSRRAATRTRRARTAKKPRYAEDETEDEREAEVVDSKTRKVSRRQNNRKARRGHRTGTGTDDDEDEDDKSAAANTFGLFFGTVEADDLRNRSIGFEEIKKILTELGEQMTDGEIKEMLDYASYSNDSRVSLGAFEKLLKEIRTV